ncbi:DUF4153 domain-containing protein [Cellulomonas sp. P22]|uniref:DUF4153 domain-containing protein n=1 Tax=Cellulomonas sp. P22 TaxID=3373189 RepID=UPI0037A993E6
MSELNAPTPGPVPVHRGAGAVGPALPRAAAAPLREFWEAHPRVADPRTLLVCAAVGVAGAVLLVGHSPGLGAAVTGLAVWAAALPALVRRRAVGALVTAGLSVALLAVVAVRDAGWVVGVCVATAAWAGAVAVTSGRSATAVVLSPVSWAAGLVRALPWLVRGGRDLMGGRRGQLVVALRSIGVTVLLLMVFGALFASADTVFSSYLPHIELGSLPARLAVGALVAVGAAALAHLALAPPAWSDVALPEARPARRGEWLLPVLALDAMVLAFVLVQVGALLGGHRHVLETAGLTYAEYAREGFAQLMATTALTLAVVAVGARYAPRATARDRVVSRVGLGVLCVGTLGVVASALRRMDLYVDVFGLTRLRVFVVVVELVMAAVLVLVLVAGVRWRAGWLPRTVVQVVAVAMLGLAVANPDAMIARHNTAAGPDAPLMDLTYLQGLSADAVPVLDQLSEPWRSCVLGGAHVDAPQGPADWNLGRERAATVLASGASTSGVPLCSP